MKHQSVFIFIFLQSEKMGKQLNKGDKNIFISISFHQNFVSPSTHPGSGEKGKKSLLRRKFTQKIVINSSINALRSYFSHCVQQRQRGTGENCQLKDIERILMVNCWGIFIFDFKFLWTCAVVYKLKCGTQGHIW